MTIETDQQKLIIKSKQEEISKIESFVEEILKQSRVSEENYGNIFISVIEGINNAINHGNNNDETKDIILSYYISENKKNTDGIKIDEINAKLTSIANKYGISNPKIKLSLPEVIKGGVFDLKTANVMMTTASINFTAINDIKAMMFANEFINSLKGYPVVTSFNISKSKEYTLQELLDVSTGKSSGVVSGKIDFFWYVYKDLEKKPNETKNPGTENKVEVLDAKKEVN
jgi:hypothetical protein